MEMTLNEAIQHLDETLNDTSRTWVCEECKQEHIQLREWLIELSKLRESYKPRMLVIDEIKDYDDVMYMEIHDTKDVFPVLYVDSNQYQISFKSSHYSLHPTSNGYNSLWRLWNIKPTNEQRKNEPWANT